VATTLSVPARPARPSPTLADAKPFGYVVVLAWLGGHVVLGVGGALSAQVATAHAALTIVVSLAVLTLSPRVERLVAVAVYGGVCDVYWRMTGSRAPWELSKYLLALGAVVILVRFVPRWTRAGLPIVFLLALLPGVVVTFGTEGVAAGREMVSSTEMGLLAFGAAALAFRHLVATRTDAWNLCWIVLGPLVAILGVTSYTLVTTPDIDFSSESNFDASGGYGPNQVSSALGLIMLICILMAFLPKVRQMWPVLAGLGAWSLWAAFLTFSRGGIYSIVIAGAAMALVGISTRGARLRSLTILAVVVLGLFLVFSSANDFSGNWLDTRYGEADTAGRTNIAELDLDVFGSHPLSGVGSGRAEEFRQGDDRLTEAAAHTEFTRVLAEHGLFGLIALALLVVMLVQGYRRALTHWNRLMVVALGAWALTTMLHAATRIGAVPVMLALTQIRVEEPARTAPAPARTRARSSSPPDPPDEPDQRARPQSSAAISRTRSR
jgi:O-antigen ligase